MSLSRSRKPQPEEEKQGSPPDGTGYSTCQDWNESFNLKDLSRATSDKAAHSSPEKKLEQTPRSDNGDSSEANRATKSNESHPEV